MNIGGEIFIGFVVCMFIAVLIGIYSNRQEREDARKAKEQSDAEYREQQTIHQGDC